LDSSGAILGVKLIIKTCAAASSNMKRSAAKFEFRSRFNAGRWM